MSSCVIMDFDWVFFFFGCVFCRFLITGWFYFPAVAVCGEKVSADLTSFSFAWWVSTCCMFPFELYKLNTSPEYVNVMLTALG